MARTVSAFRPARGLDATLTSARAGGRRVAGGAGFAVRAARRVIGRELEPAGGAIGAAAGITDGCGPAGASTRAPAASGCAPGPRDNCRPPPAVTTATTSATTLTAAERPRGCHAH